MKAVVSTTRADRRVDVVLDPQVLGPQIDHRYLIVHVWSAQFTARDEASVLCSIGWKRLSLSP